MKKILFRADGNREIGLGHFMRLISLVEILKDDFHCTFAIQAPEKYVQTIIADNGVELINLRKTQDYISEAQYLASLAENFDVVIFDGYFFKTEYQKILKKGNWKLVYIDDLHEFKIEADLILNHAVGLNESQYNVNETATICLGTQYAMLRSSFLEASKRDRKFDNDLKVFVCLGGSDPNNYTLSIVKKLVKFENLYRISVVVGVAYPFYDELKKVKDSRLNILKGLTPDEMAIVMNESNIGVVSSSNISFEYASIGGMMFVIQTADNQEDIHRFIVTEKLGIHFDQISEEILGKELFEQQLANQRKYFDGKSNYRIIKKIKKLLC